jgi:hypothetical protein
VDVQWISVICVIVGAAFGAFVGVRVAIASLKERVTVLESEVKLLREAKHSHAGFLTQHELRIENIERDLKRDQR